MTEAEYNRIKKMGQKATNDLYQEFKAEFDDEALQKCMHDSVNICWEMFKSRINSIDTPEFWKNPVDHLKVFEIIRRLMRAYCEIYEQLWKETYANKYGIKNDIQ